MADRIDVSGDLLAQLDGFSLFLDTLTTAQTPIAETLLAARQWIQVIRSLKDNTLESNELEEICAFGLQLVDTLSNHCREQETPHDFLVPFPYTIGLWFVRHGVTLHEPESVIDALSTLSNASRNPQTLATLAQGALKIIDAVPEMIKQEATLDSHNHIGRVLLFNAGIVATRSHDTALMDQVFAKLVHYLPQTAKHFFTEGKQQVEIESLGYPLPVKENMLLYYQNYVLGQQN